MAALLPPPRLVVAGHDANGKSIVTSDTRPELFGPFGPQAAQFTTLFTTSSFPASNTATTSSPQEPSIPRPGKNGTVFCTSDIPPHCTSAFHRTRTLDYMVVLKGAISLRLDDEKEVTLGEGEMLVQRGTIHAWVNRSDAWCRMLFLMLDAAEVELENGTVLGEEFHPHVPGKAVVSQ